MKLNDIVQIKNLINDVKQISDAQSYSVSATINQKLVQILPILDAEQKRLEFNDVEINFPKICIFTNKDIINENLSVQDFMNIRLKQLVVNGNKIIDYGKLDEEYDDSERIVYFYIKYTD